MTMLNEPARRAVFFAGFEARQSGSPEITREHLLLGILRECKLEMAREFNLSFDKIRTALIPLNAANPSLTPTISKDVENILLAAEQKCDEIRAAVFPNGALRTSAQQSPQENLRESLQSIHMRTLSLEYIIPALVASSGNDRVTEIFAKCNVTPERAEQWFNRKLAAATAPFPPQAGTGLNTAAPAGP